MITCFGYKRYRAIRLALIWAFPGLLNITIKNIRDSLQEVPEDRQNFWVTSKEVFDESIIDRKNLKFPQISSKNF